MLFARSYTATLAEISKIVGLVGGAIAHSLGFHPTAKLGTAMAGAFPPV